MSFFVESLCAQKIICYNFCFLLFKLLQAINNSFNGHGQNDSRIPVPFTSFEMDVAVAIYAIGGMFGALPAGFLADLVGR